MLKHLTENQKIHRMSVSMQHFMRFQEMGYQLFSRIIAADEIWRHHFDPDTKSKSMDWRYPSSPRPKKTRSPTRGGKVMLTCFFDANGQLLL
ncbi:hypothetical protein NPIL_666351 [Nephila pilipes]|uniref:Transposase n=1 Tax=Nephila pilipes TaxID=299642 RepID=A0A8X6PEW5_NEPPI|nr:hypothetical protein NPIL_666351 [Nephila pilipes]